VINVVTLESFDPEEVMAICRALFTAYGVGSEPTGALALPAAAQTSDGLDAAKLLAEVESVKTFADDKILYLVQRPFHPRPSPVGALPTFGFADFGGERATISARLATQGQTTPEGRAARLSKLAVHEVGHLWDLHHCIDARCSMTPPWGVSFAQGSSAELCSFCRDKSERKMKLSLV
jgi:predicted Zn-dependent protease